MTAMAKRVAFRLSDEELEMLKDQCECNGQTMTEYIKFLILNDSKPIDGYEINLKGGD